MDEKEREGGGCQHLFQERFPNSQEFAKLSLKDTVRDKLPLLADLSGGGHCDVVVEV